MKKILCTQLSLFSLVIPVANANFQKLGKEFLENSYKVKQVEQMKENARLNHRSFETSKNWNASVNTYLNKGKQQQQFGSTLINAESNLTTADVTFSKSNFYGTTASLKSSLVTGDYFGNDYHSFGQTLSVSQNIGQNLLGKSDRENLEALNMRMSAANQSFSSQRDGLVRGFYFEVINAELRKSLVELEREALKRSKKTAQLVKRKVRDGLREKVDLLQAESNVLSSLNQLRRSESALKDALKIVSSSVQRNVSESEITSLNQATKLTYITMNPELVREGLIDSYEKNLKAAKLEESSASRRTGLDLNIVATYTTSYIGDSDEIISKGNLTGDKYDLKTGIQLTIPLGESSSESSAAKTRVARMVEEAKLKGIEIEKNEELKFIINEYKTQGKILDSLKEQVNLSEKSLKEYQKLYRNGRVEIDVVISAEQALIGSQKSYLMEMIKKSHLEASYYVNRGEFVQEVLK